MMTTTSLKTYYATIFPMTEILCLITMNGKCSSYERILAFQFPNDIMKRYIEKYTSDTLERMIKEQHPLSIHCGRAAVPLFPVHHNKDLIICNIRKELVFDVDASDYDKIPSKSSECEDNIKMRIRPCECDKSACDKCWYLIQFASKVIDYFITNIYDYKSLLWVFSGNRGIHCWINDKHALSLSKETRETIIKSMILKSDEEIINYLTNKDYYISSTMKEIYHLLLQYFLSDDHHVESLMNNQKFIDIILQYIDRYYNNIHGMLKKKWHNLHNTTGKEKWKQIEMITTKFNIIWKYNGGIVLPPPHQFIIFRLFYPQFDEKVTIDTGEHLLKLPFSIHHSTKALSLPMTFEEIINKQLKDFIIKPFIDGRGGGGDNNIKERISLLEKFNKCYIS